MRICKKIVSFLIPYHFMDYLTKQQKENVSVANFTIPNFTSACLKRITPNPTHWRRCKIWKSHSKKLNTRRVRNKSVLVEGHSSIQKAKKEKTHPLATLSKQSTDPVSWKEQQDDLLGKGEAA